MGIYLHNLQEQRDDQFASLSAQLEMYEKLNTVAKDFRDPLLLHALERTKAQIRNHLGDLLKSGTDIVDLVSKFGSELFRADLITAQDTIAKREATGGETSTMPTDLVSEDQFQKARVNPIAMGGPKDLKYPMKGAPEFVDQSERFPNLTSDQYNMLAQGFSEQGEIPNIRKAKVTPFDQLINHPRFAKVFNTMIRQLRNKTRAKIPEGIIAEDISEEEKRPDRESDDFETVRYDEYGNEIQSDIERFPEDDYARSVRTAIHNPLTERQQSIDNRSAKEFSSEEFKTALKEQEEELKMIQDQLQQVENQLISEEQAINIASLLEEVKAPKQEPQRLRVRSFENLIEPLTEEQIVTKRDRQSQNQSPKQLTQIEAKPKTKSAQSSEEEKVQQQIEHEGATEKDETEEKLEMKTQKDLEEIHPELKPILMRVQGGKASIIKTQGKLQQLIADLSRITNIDSDIIEQYAFLIGRDIPVTLNGNKKLVKAMNQQERTTFIEDIYDKVLDKYLSLNKQQYQEYQKERQEANASQSTSTSVLFHKFKVMALKNDNQEKIEKEKKEFYDSILEKVTSKIKGEKPKKKDTEKIAHSLMNFVLGGQK